MKHPMISYDFTYFIAKEFIDILKELRYIGDYLYVIANEERIEFEISLRGYGYYECEDTDIAIHKLKKVISDLLGVKSEPLRIGVHKIGFDLSLIITYDITEDILNSLIVLAAMKGEPAHKKI